MRATTLVAAIITAVGLSAASAQTPLSDYADANGFIDVQALTCLQLASTYQEDADALTSWYSGWYNGLAHKHFADFRRGKGLEHEVILYCEAHPEIRVIDAIAVIFKDERIRLGIQMRPD